MVNLFLSLSLNLLHDAHGWKFFAEERLNEWEEKFLSAKVNWNATKFSFQKYFKNLLLFFTKISAILLCGEKSCFLKNFPKKHGISFHLVSRINLYDVERKINYSIHNTLAEWMWSKTIYKLNFHVERMSI